MASPGQVQTLVVLDHHKTAAADLAGLGTTGPNIHLEFDMRRSGARLAWDWFHPNERRCSLAVRYVEDRDLWRCALPYSRQVTTGIDAYEQTLESWDALAERDLEEVRIVRINGVIAITARYQAFSAAA